MLQYHLLQVWRFTYVLYLLNCYAGAGCQWSHLRKAVSACSCARPSTPHCCCSSCMSRCRVTCIKPVLPFTDQFCIGDKPMTLDTTVRCVMNWALQLPTLDDRKRRIHCNTTTCSLVSLLSRSA